MRIAQLQEDVIPLQKISPQNEESKREPSKKERREQFKKDLRFTVISQFSNLIENPIYSIPILVPKLKTLNKYLANSFVLCFCGLLIYESFIQWWELSDSKKWINGSNCPWGVIYLIVIMPVFSIQGAGYSLLSPEIKNLLSLKDDLVCYFQIGNPVHLDRVINNQIQILLNLTLLAIQFFAPGFHIVVINLVALEFFSQIEGNINKEFFYYYFRPHRIRQLEQSLDLNQHGIDVTNLNQVYCKVWKISAPKKDDLSDEELAELMPQKLEEKFHEISRQHHMVYIFFFPRITTSVRVLWFFLSAGLLFGAVYTKAIAWMQSDKVHIEDSQVPWGVIYVGISLPILLIQGVGPSIIDDDQRQYFTLKQDYSELCRRLGKTMKQVTWDEKTLWFYYYSRHVVNYLLIGSLIALQFFSESFSEAILNLCAIEFIGNFEVVALKNFFLNIRIPKLQIWANDEKTGIQAQIKKFKSFNELYCYWNSIDKTVEPISESTENKKEAERLQLKQLVYEKLGEVRAQLIHEEGFQLPLYSPSTALSNRFLQLLLMTGYLGTLILGAVVNWMELDEDKKFIDGTPWGVVYICISLPIIAIQGIGKSEENDLDRFYRKLRLDYWSLSTEKQPYHYDWNDQDLQTISAFNAFQNMILVAGLLTLQYFTGSFSEAVLNLVALEFLSNIDEHAIGNILRNMYYYKFLKTHWRHISPVYQLENRTFKSLYRHIWQVESADAD